MLWDIQHAARTRSMVPAIRDAAQRALVERVLDRYDAVVAPVWPSFRAQVVHTDLTTDNALVDERGRITGIVDFGDASHSALIVDLAGVLDSLLADRHGDELFRAARLILDGYQRHVPLEPLELRLLGELLATRAAVTITISSWRSDRGLEDAAFAERYNAAVAAHHRGAPGRRLGRGRPPLRGGGRRRPRARALRDRRDRDDGARPSSRSATRPRSTSSRPTACG